jgi:hypothetical protein
MALPLSVCKTTFLTPPIGMGWNVVDDAKDQLYLRGARES